MGGWYETEVRVRYAETDQMGIVHHANYLIWFEVGRSDLCRQKGFSYREMEDDDSLMVVAGAQIRYKAPAFYDDLLTIRTKVSEIRSRSIRFIYEVRRGSDEAILAEGETVHFVTDKSRKVKSLPAAYKDKLS
jgi:acyl-CoA thioester hydrolase